MKILVCGANGQLGQELRFAFNEDDSAFLKKEDLDITDPKAVQAIISDLKPAFVINAAAYTQVDQAELEPKNAFRVNAEGPKNLAIETARHKIPLLHFSTDYVFRGDIQRPYHEFDGPNPQSVYGKSKWEGEKAVLAENPRTFLVRTAWLYSQFGQNFPKKILSKTRNEPIRVVNDQIGSPTYGPHLVAGIQKLIREGGYGTYHLAGQGETNWLDFSHQLFRSLELKVTLSPISTSDLQLRSPRPAYSALKTVQSPKILLPPWQEGIEVFSKLFPQKIP